jgi:hypothetical protein
MYSTRNNRLFALFIVSAVVLSAFSFASAEGEKNPNGAAHRSAVGTFMRNLLDVADREKGEVGEEIKAVAKEQDEAKDKVADAIDKIQNRGKLKTFLIGTDYRNMGALRSEMVKTRNQIDKLGRLIERASSSESKTALEEQLKTLQGAGQKIEDLLKANESKFSVFGWFVKLFSK